MQQMQVLYCISEFLHRHGHLLSSKQQPINTRNAVLQLLNQVLMGSNN